MSAQGDLLTAALTAAAGAAGSVALVLALGARPWRGRAHPTPAWCAPVALGTGSALGFWLTRGRPSFPPTQAVQWLFYAALAGAALGVLEAFGPRRVRALRLLAAALLPFVMLEFQRARHWPGLAGILLTAGLALLVLAAWSTLSAQEERPPGGGATALGLALTTALAAGSYGLSGGALFAQLAGALALATGLCALLGFWRRGPGLGPAGVAPFVLLYYGQTWIARWVNELSTASFVLLSLAPLAALTARLMPASRARLAAGLALGLPPLLAAAALALEFAGADASAYG